MHVTVSEPAREGAGSLEVYGCGFFTKVTVSADGYSFE